MKQVVDIEKPDIAIVQIGNSIGLAQALEARGVPVLFYLHNVDIDDLGGDPRALSHARFIANSRFTAERYRSVFGIDSAVIPPLVRAEDYRTRRGRANVTMINPHPVKGQEVMLKVARACPDIPFHLVESWPLHSEEAESLVRAIARLPNVRFTRRTSDMKSIYGAAKFLLAPSICEEAWGRVATEAHFSGIPVIASDRGGLPESVGPGGVLLDPEGGIEPWIDAVRKMWTDKAFYERMSEAALAYSRRPEIQPEHLAAALIEEGQALARRAASRRREEVPA
jgi:glycosyltransferase involved in cell wall biosynthesis